MIFIPPITPAAVIKRIAAANQLDARLAATDRWLWRWAASSGSGLPVPADAVPIARVPPLAPEDAIRTDHIVSDAPYNWPRFVHSWYRSEKSAEQLAEVIGLSRSAIYVEHKIVLGYLLGQFRAVHLIVPSFPGL